MTHGLIYGTVTTHIPLEDFYDSEAPAEEDGVLSYSYSYEWLYNEAMNYKSTAQVSGTVDVTCDDYTTVKESKTGETEIWMHANIHFKDDMNRPVM